MRRRSRAGRSPWSRACPKAPTAAANRQAIAACETWIATRLRAVEHAYRMAIERDAGAGRRSACATRVRRCPPPPRKRPEHAYLSDFGLSKGVQSSAGLTASGRLTGYPRLLLRLSRVRGGHADGRADQYALACVAFVLLTGTLPFRRPAAVAAMFAHLQDPVPLVTGLRPELPVAVDGVIARALAKSPEQRYGQCGDFAAALQEVLVPARSATVLDGGPSDGLLVSGGQEARQKVLASSMQSTPVSSARPSGPQGTGPVSQASAADGRAAQENLGYASTITGGIGGTSDTPAAAATARCGGGQPRRPHRRTALIGGTVALALAVAGIVYAVQLPGSPAEAAK